MKRSILGQVTLAAVTSNSKSQWLNTIKIYILLTWLPNAGQWVYCLPSSYSGIRTSFMLERHHPHLCHSGSSVDRLREEKEYEESMLILHWIWPDAAYDLLCPSVG